MTARRSTTPRQRSRGFRKALFSSILSVAVLGGTAAASFAIIERAGFFAVEYNAAAVAETAPVLNKALYDWKMRVLANDGGLNALGSTTPAAKKLWPPQTAYPNGGALLPFNRIVAYYGNFSAPAMGVLGQFPPDEMLARLQAEADKWRAADPTTPVIPSLDYIAIVAQGSPGPNGLYRLRMSDQAITYAIHVADRIHGLIFLDVQVGLSDLQSELPYLEKYLRLPEVELSIDPEFATRGMGKPGFVIGAFDARDINAAAEFLAKIVRENNLPPKILVVHRFTEEMVTNYEKITPLPEVQIVMDMDGWGTPARKLSTYQTTIYREPVQFAGLKLFYKNDLWPPSTRMLTPEEILALKPRPIYIQYQ